MHPDIELARRLVGDEDGREILLPDEARRRGLLALALPLWQRLYAQSPPDDASPEDELLAAKVFILAHPDDPGAARSFVCAFRERPRNAPLLGTLDAFLERVTKARQDALDALVGPSAFSTALLERLRPPEGWEPHRGTSLRSGVFTILLDESAWVRRIERPFFEDLTDYVEILGPCRARFDYNGLVGEYRDGRAEFYAYGHEEGPGHVDARPWAQWVICSVEAFLAGPREHAGQAPRPV